MMRAAELPIEQPGLLDLAMERGDGGGIDPAGDRDAIPQLVGRTVGALVGEAEFGVRPAVDRSRWLRMLIVPRSPWSRDAGHAVVTNVRASPMPRSAHECGAAARRGLAKAHRRFVKSAVSEASQRR